MTSVKDTRVSMTRMGVRPRGLPRRWGQRVHALQELGGLHCMGVVLMLSCPGAFPWGYGISPCPRWVLCPT